MNLGCSLQLPVVPFASGQQAEEGYATLLELHPQCALVLLRCGGSTVEQSPQSVPPRQTSFQPETQDLLWFHFVISPLSLTDSKPRDLRALAVMIVRVPLVRVFFSGHRAGGGHVALLELRQSPQLVRPRRMSSQPEPIGLLWFGLAVSATV